MKTMLNPNVIRAYIQIKSLELVELVHTEHSVDEFNKLFDELQDLKQRLDRFDLDFIHEAS